MKRTLNFTIIAVCSMYLLLRIGALVKEGFQWSHVIWAHVYLAGIAIAIIWETQARHASKAATGFPVQGSAPAPVDPDERPLVSLVALLPVPAVIDDATLRERLSAEFQTPIGASADDESFLVCVDETTHALRVEGRKFVIVNSPSPYVKDRESEALTAKSPDLAHAILVHNGWRAVDWIDETAEPATGQPSVGQSPSDDPMPATDFPTAKADAYRLIGRALAEVVSDTTPLALFCPENGNMAVWDVHSHEVLHSAEPQRLAQSAQVAV